MAHILEIHDDYGDVEIVPSDGGELTIDTPNVQEFLIRFKRWAANVPIVVFSIEKVAGNEYDVSFQHSDGRLWTQKLFLGTEVEDCLMTFSVTDRWRLDEIRPHRSVRDQVIRLLLSHDIATIEIRRTL